MAIKLVKAGLDYPGRLGRTDPTSADNLLASRLSLYPVRRTSRCGLVAYLLGVGMLGFLEDGQRLLPGLAGLGQLAGDVAGVPSG